MTTRREVSRTHVTSIAKLMSGDNSCMYSAWFRSWHERYRKAETDGTGLAEWNMRHTTMMHETVALLEKDGYEVSIEGQNWFETRSSQTGSIIIGKPDIISASPGGRVTVHDIKTGQPRASDEIQVKLYMLLLPLSGHPRWSGVRMDGKVLYANSRAVKVSADDLTPEFRHSLAVVMRQVVAPEPARLVPSARECGWCVVSSDDCNGRIAPHATSPGGSDRNGDMLHSC